MKRAGFDQSLVQGVARKNEPLDFTEFGEVAWSGRPRGRTPRIR